MTQSLNIKDLGNWKTVRGLFVKEAGVWKPVRKAFVKTGGVWKQFFQGEVVVTLTNSATHITLKSLFTSNEWNNALLNKRVVVPAGVTIGTASATQVILPTPTADGQAGSFAGDLTLDISGTISGLGGAANSGVGGTCILGNLPGKDGRKMIVNLRSGGIIRAGGGGGGKGGQGGQGYYLSPYTAQDGPSYNRTVVSGMITGVSLPQGGGYNYYWNGSFIGSSGLGTSIVSGPYTYYVGALQEVYQGTADVYGYAIYRQYTAYNTIYTSGGAGGNGGRGQGFDGAAAAGTGGAAGGTNAGTGGTGGTGGAYGATGGTGATGVAGNNGSGVAGTAGGLAGFYLNGQANVQLNNLGGTVQGRLA